jgi:hypothetical protein
MKKSYKHLTDSDFKNLKKLQEAGVSAYRAAGVSGRASQTVLTVYKSKTFAEYKQRVKDYNVVHKAKPAQTELASVVTIDEIVNQAREGGRVVLTNAKNFGGVLDIATFVSKMNKRGVAVAVFPESED